MRKTVIIAFLLLLSCSTYQEPSIYEKKAERALSRANLSMSEMDYNKSISYIDDAIYIAKANNLPHIKIKALLQKAKIFVATGGYKEASYLIKEAKEVAKEEKNGYMPYVEYAEAVYFWELGDIKEAKNIIKNMDEVPKDLRGAYHNLKALLELKGGNLDTAEKEVKDALKYAEKLKDLEQLSYSNKVMGIIKLKQKNSILAIENVKSALEIDRKVGNREALLWDLNFLGDMQKEKGDKELAFSYYYQGYELAVAIGDKGKRDFFLEKAFELLK